MSNYRKIYEQHYGPIPKDKDGRSYEIHHIDGNHKNDSPENLKAVTIQEHYNIHYSQEDWGSCFKIASRMKISPQEHSEIARKSAVERVENGTHHLLSGEIQKRSVNKQISNGTYHTLRRSDGSSLSSDRVKNGTHNLLKRLDGTSQTADRVKNGTHPFMTKPDGTCLAAVRVKNGTHHFLGDKNPNKNMPKITCPHCGKTGGRNLMKRYHFDNCRLVNDQS